ncbi:MAG: methyltransferase domain-containing protein, partial [Clostridia bacterium]
EDGARCIVEVNINNDFAVVTIDTSGDGLHKRGYRDLAYTAPIKETTASALIDLSVMRRDKQFVDLFCGSGTLPIEVAMRECCIAPGLQRTFDYCDWECVPKDCYEKSVVEAKDSIKLLPNLDIRGYDINPEAISISRRHAKRAGVDFVKFEVADMREFKSVTPYGVMISNVPYGERLSDEQEVLPLYKDLGKLYKTLPDWNFYILTAQLDFEKYFGKWASKKRKLYNANIECCYYAFNGNPPPKSNNFTKDTID